MACDVPFPDLQKPVAFPKNKEEPSESREIEPSILGGLVNQRDPVFISHPVSLFLIKVVVLPKSPNFF
jgi:hypothetical protein